MKLISRILNINWYNIATYAFFLGWITFLYSNLSKDVELSQAFAATSSFFWGIQTAGIFFVIVQFLIERDIKKIIKENKISVIE